MNRNQIIIRTSGIGIAGNILLSAFKLAVGIAAHSVAIITDGVNNITDALSFLITIVGTRLSEKKPDREHPFGYGRIEYLAALVTGIVILYAGFDAVRNSVESLLHPEPNDYSPVTLIVVAGAVLVKIIVGRYTKIQGKRRIRRR